MLHLVGCEIGNDHLIDTCVTVYMVAAKLGSLIFYV